MYQVKSTLSAESIRTPSFVEAMTAAAAFDNAIVLDDTATEVFFKKTAFKFSELDDKAKDRARNWYCEDLTLWTDNYEQFLTICGFAEPKLYFSVCYSQSDFAAFESHYFDYEKGFVKKVAAEFGEGSEFHKLAIQLRGIYARSFYKICGSVKTGSRDRAYCDMHHEYDTYEDDLNEWINDVCHEIKKGLYADYEYQCSDESVSENCNANEYLFDENGGII